jgi:hypothetical protein
MHASGFSPYNQMAMFTGERMHITQLQITQTAALAEHNLPADTDLMLVFGARRLLQDGELFPALRRACPHALIAGCSTAGEIRGTEVHDGSIVITALRFADTRVRMVAAKVELNSDSREAGESLSRELLGDGLRHVMVLSDGLQVNGSELVLGLRAALPPGVNVTGGLAGDGPDFGATVVLADAPAAGQMVAAIGFYGERLRIGYGSVGGWDAFGPERQITRAEGNRLFELDGESALSLYKAYLGKQAEGLPASALLFPLALHQADTDTYVVRTVLGVDEARRA